MVLELAGCLAMYTEIMFMPTTTTLKLKWSKKIIRICFCISFLTFLIWHRIFQSGKCCDELHHTEYHAAIVSNKYSAAVKGCKCLQNI